MDGPETSMGGEINIASFHLGENVPGQQFNVANPHFKHDYMGPYADFLIHVYSLDVHSAQVLGQTANVKG
ncbi:hypothetical protein C0995_000361 [Termitomyces sp. Mi166|nr:hypothetical protein C0995_000361 [Termitomyces sp. Mi166\